MSKPIGEVVRIRRDLNVDTVYRMKGETFNYNIATQSMVECRGKVAKIIGKSWAGQYYLNIGGNKLGWTDEMFEKVNVE